MVDSGSRPAAGVVAGCAIGAEGTGVGIPAFMTGIAVFRSPFVNAVNMT